MARGVTFQQLIHKLRAETGRSTSLAQGAQELDHLKQILQRTQEDLYDRYDWEFKNITRDESMVAGSRYYTLDSDLSFDNVSYCVCQPSNGESWYDVAYGIDEHLYNILDSDQDEREEWVRHWDQYEGNQYEVWPIPATSDATLRFRGKKVLSALVADSDTADLDDQLIVLHAAAELLAPDDGELAALKLKMAERRLATLLGLQSKSAPVNLTQPRAHGRRPHSPLYGRRKS